MPKIYEYLGIVILFYSDDHDPIHVHAVYGENTIKVSFFIKDGKIYNITFNEVKGKFTPAKLKQLQDFISLYKEKIVQAWDKYFIWKSNVEFKRITKKI